MNSSEIWIGEGKAKGRTVWIHWVGDEPYLCDRRTAREEMNCSGSLPYIPKPKKPRQPVGRAKGGQ